ncbi:mannosyltransferase [Subsaxibacter sp. CAU 1640]|uniref:mannosyltransferase n=1 Tax=Subsaxibacter sp. CAU 1640 TaxID=2933271 RepID=UPI002006A7E7|nr:mannosyltransferase [Subsaxibacter sp. CAU 1640]MCK7589023.1 mannosyltransferase [Subsaxibacter sp. CAU 1640]
MLNTANFKIYKTPVLYALLSILLYWIFAYDLVRTDFSKLLLLYSGLFLLFYKLMQNHKVNFNLLLIFAAIFRIMFLFAIPNLSQDFYRFIWDGRLLIEGLNPYLYKPESFIQNNQFPIAQAQELYQGMGTLNGSHFTNYPPIKQCIFTVAAFISGKSIIGSAIVFRVFIITADFGTLYFGKKLLEKLNIPVNKIFWYILNPFIIIELTGSLHFEGVMVFFLVWSLYLLYVGKWKLAAAIFGLSVSTKLIPLLLLPLFFQWFTKRQSNDFKPLGFYKLISYYSIVAIVIILLFAPFFSSEFISNYSKTVGLWFTDFEFNASIYYVAREIGYVLTGYNQIAVIGKFIPVIVILFSIAFTFIRNSRTMPNLICSMVLLIAVYYFVSTTIHPWYLTTILALSIFTNYKFPLIWSFVIVLSYFTYANSNYSENLWVIGLEYLLVYAVFVWEVFFKKPNSQKFLVNS